MKRSFELLVVLGILGLTTTASATTSTFHPTKDAMIFATSGGADTGNASGKGPGMFAGADGGSNKKRSLLYFNIGATIPPGSTIVSAELELIVGQVAGTGGGGGGGSPPCGMPCASRTFRVYTLTNDWSEGNTGLPTATAMSGTGQGWDYSACNCNDVSWDYRNYSTPSSWMASGTDYATPEVISLTQGPTFTIGMSTTFYGDGSVNTSFRNAVKAWVDTPSSNKGWMIKSDIEHIAVSFLGWWTIDGATARGTVMTEAPLLTIVWN